MPLYYYRCSKCKRSQRRIQTPEQAKEIQECGLPLENEKTCSYVTTREPRPPSSQATEILDNGLMTKRLERLVDAERLFAERNEAIKKNQQGE